MARFILICLLCVSSQVSVTSLGHASADKSYTVRSPDGKITMYLSDADGLLRYHVERAGETVIQSSLLGMRFAHHHGFDEHLKITDSHSSSNNTLWEQPWGERREVRDHHNELLLNVERTDHKQLINVRARVFNDGIGFRYELPQQEGLSEVAITEEFTEFNMDQNATAWWIPARKWNRYEYLYQTSTVDQMEMVHTPVTMRLSNGLHVSLHEAALVDYAGMSIEHRRGPNLVANLAPRSDGALVKRTLPFHSPWRTIQIAPDAVGLVNSDLILNLNEPNKMGDVSWFKPGKYIGIWWQQHIMDRTWGNDGIHAATTEATIEYMDFAAEHGFDGVLVEGWNIGWDGDWYNNGDVFSFTETYDDFDIEKVAEHGRKVGVRLIGHHETSGNTTNYEKQIDEAFDLYQKNDVAIVKTGYVADAGKLKRIDENGITRYEFHDSQANVNHHQRVIEKAAEHQIAINPHEPVKDTGLRRTYPNWVSREGARGQEFNAWGVPPNGPNHVSNLVFTRMLSGPMDYTAGAFDLRPSERPPITAEMGRHDKRSRIEHTLAKELSLYVAIYSPIQMAMDLPENYAARLDAFQFIKDVPADWEQSIALSGEVGEFLVIARQDRHSDDWYLSAHTNESARTVTADLSFLGQGRYQAQIYRDGAQADYDTNPYDIVIEQRDVTAADTLTFKLGRSGGAAVRFKKL
ncbi:alpha-glucosidase [Arenicella xantha]|uniref:Alpha-glucosidase n=2 Tax=Arenicella xantha TaxID=644221 RepID=A0A395JNI3_9GAMM|nr:glycoside hydrolase family 97 protein [Arenicella xantha]RBP51357.1 alpha-glucosidase [Arenicella xantha]